MPSTDRKLELKAKTSVAQTASQAAVYESPHLNMFRLLSAAHHQEAEHVYSGTSVHERPCSRTIRFTNKFSEQKPPRMTNGVSDYEHASWQEQQAESIGAGVSCRLTLAQYTSLLDFGLRTFRFRNGLQERIKFVYRGSTVYSKLYF
jgi:hypothetical protein